MSLTAGTRLGPYEIVALLGRGGMGEVYRARDTALDRDVALKTLPESLSSDPDRLMRFEREARTLASLNHPNIAAIYGIEDRAIVMELVEGRDLSDVIRSSEAGPSGPANLPGLKTRPPSGAIAVDEALPIARQIAEALEAAHEAGIIHRDLKPANVKVRADGTVKVLDFGLAKALVPGAEAPGLHADGGVDLQARSDSPTMTSPALTAMGIILGTAAYMSPEQARGRTVDKRADIWAFGVVLFEMLTGRPVFHGEDMTGLLAAVLKDAPDWDALPRSTPPRVRLLLRRCLEKDPRRRLRDIGDARLELDAQATPEAPTARVAVHPLWRRAAPWIAAGVAVFLAWLAGANLGPTQQATPPLARVALELALPERVDWPPALSWNGDSVAWASEEGVRVRRLDSVSIRTLSGTKGATRVAWHPDGARIVFIDRQNEQLKIIRLTDEVVRPLAPVGLVNAPIAISAAGDVLFIDTPGGGPRIVAASGGEVRTPLALKDGTVSVPRAFLQDGQSFVYITRDLSSSVGAGTVRVASLDGSNDRELPDWTGLLTSAEGGITQFTFIPSGSLVFARGGAMFLQPVDPATLALQGNAAVMDTGVMPDDRLAFSADGRVHAWTQRQSALLPPQQLSWVESGGNVIALGAPERMRSFALDPEGRRVVAEISDENTRGARTDLWLIDPARGNVRTRLTTTTDLDEQWPIWAADGASIGAVATTMAVGGRSQLVSVPVANPDAVRILLDTPSPALSTGFTWTRDMRQLIDTRLNIETAGRQGTDLFRIALDSRDTAQPYLVSSFMERAPRLSPNDDWVALTSDRSGTFEIYIDRFPTASGLIPVSGGPATSHRWSTSGHTLYFIADGRLMAVSVTPDADPVVSAPRLVVALPEGTSQCDPAPDDTRFLCMTPARVDPDDARRAETSVIQVVVNPLNQGGGER